MKVNGIIDKIWSYTEPRSTTSSDLPHSKPSSGVMSGGISGYITGGPQIALGGAVGGYIGIKTGEAVIKKTGSPELSFVSALSSAALSGGTASSLAYAGTELLLRGLTSASLQINPVFLAAAGLLGAFAGVSGTLMGSQIGDMKDGGMVGYLAGGILSAVTGTSPLLGLIGSISGAIPGVAETTGGKLVAAIVSGLITGGLSGIFAGPPAMAMNAVAGAVLGIIGTFAGPKIMQVFRNLAEDAASMVKKIILPASKKFGKTGNIVLGAVGGAIGMIPLSLAGGMLAGALGIIAPSVIGAFLGAKKIIDIYKQKEKTAEVSAVIRPSFKKPSYLAFDYF